MMTTTTATTTRRTGASNGGSCGHVFHYAKFRWTENLTCRFIQLRRQHGKMFTGRKYSAQAGWEYILRQMREEFPTVMADVHYRVLKKKWSNLLQQYKELKNPVQGDKNKADDISWPFFAAIDQVVGSSTTAATSLTTQLRRCRRRRASNESSSVAAIDDDDLNPQEFLCVSVATDDDAPLVDYGGSDVVGCNDVDAGGEAENEAEDECRSPQQRQSFEQRRGQGPVFDVERITGRGGRASRRAPASGDSGKRRSASIDEGSCSEPALPGIRPSLASATQPGGAINGGLGAGVQTSEAAEEEDGAAETRPRKCAKWSQDYRRHCCGGESRIAELLAYQRQRDAENRCILMRMLEAIEDIRDAVR